MIKKKVLISIILFLFLSTNLFSFENKIIVKVNNDIITSFDLKNKIRTILFLANQSINQENINKTKIAALKQMINLKLKNQEIKKYMINVSEKEVLMNLSEISNNNIDNLKLNFSKNKLDFNLFIDEAKIEIGWRKLIYSLYNNKIDFDENEINEELKKISLERSKNVVYKISEIKISFKDQVEKSKKIEEIQDQIKIRNFKDVALRYSESGTSSNGGDLGWINEDVLSETVLKTIEKMTIGEVSLPITNLNSVIFLKLTDKKIDTAEIKNIGKIKDDLINLKKNELFELYSNSHLSKIKNSAFIEDK